MSPAFDPVPLPADGVPQAARVLARAFHDDPPVMWVIPDGRRRPRLLRWSFANTLRDGLSHGQVFTLPGLECAAIWLPPEQPFTTLPRLLRSGYLSLPLRLAPLSLLRLLGSTSRLHSHHRRDVPERHWYLAVLGVHPDRQGRGLGGAVIQPVLERADRERLPCYLETARQINVRFYRKHGFEVVREGALPLGGPRYWTMLRTPIG